MILLIIIFERFTIVYHYTSDSITRYKERKEVKLNARLQDIDFNKKKNLIGFAFDPSNVKFYLKKAHIIV